MSKRKTNEEFIKELEIKNPNIYALEEYKNNKERIWFKCKVCGEEWQTAPIHVTANDENKRTGCPKCAYVIRGEKQSLSKKDILKDVENIDGGGHYTIVDWLDYKVVGDEVWFKHLDCGHQFKMTVNNFRNGQRCPKHRYEDHSGLFKQLPHEHYWNRVVNECPDYQDYEFLERFDKGIDGKVLINHKNCDNPPFKMSVGKFLAGRRCKYCADIHNSKGIQRIKRYLEVNKIPYEIEKTFDDMMNPKTNCMLKLDVYIESMNLAIEYDGEFHYLESNETNSIYKFYDKEKLEKRQKLDEIKNQYCKDHNIPLLRISYKEQNNCEKILTEFIEKNSPTTKKVKFPKRKITLKNQN